MLLLPPPLLLLLIFLLLLLLLLLLLFVLFIHANLCVFVVTEEDEAVHRMQLDQATQAVPDMVSAAAQTTLRLPRNATTQYEARSTETMTYDEQDLLAAVRDRLYPCMAEALAHNELLDVFRYSELLPQQQRQQQQ